MNIREVSRSHIKYKRNIYTLILTVLFTVIQLVLVPLFSIHTALATTNDLTLSSDYTLVNDMAVSDLNIQGGTLNLNGHMLTVTGDITQTNGTINLNEGTLKIGGEFSQTGGTVTANKGKLYIDGSYMLSDYSQLTMSNDKDYIFVGKDFTVATNGTVSLQAGTLEVAGDFTQTGYYNFSPGGTHKVALSGKGKQTISFENPSYSYFNILELTKPLPTGYSLDTTVNWKQLIERESDPQGQTGGDLTITSDWKLPYDITINALNIQGGTLDLDGHTLTVNEDVTQINGTINLNRGTLKVGGEFSQTGGLVTANRGQLYIDGSYTLSDYSQLTMSNDKDYIFVGKDFTVATNGTVSLQAGTLEVAGDFTQTGYYNFSPSGTHKVVLSGKGKQTISFENPSYSYFNILELTKPLPTGYSLETAVNWKQLIEKESDPQEQTGGDLTITSDWELPYDITVNALNIQGGTLDLNGHTLTVNEDVAQTNGTINLNRGTLKVGGEFSQIGGLVTANRGQLYIDGSYTLSDYSQLTMSNDKDYIFVGKDFTVATNGTVSLQAGTLEVAGDFTQTGYYNFSPSGTHKVVLSGKDKQTISFENPSYSYFNILELTKPLPTGYRLETTVNWKQLIEKESDPQEQTGEDLTITSDWKLPYDITINALKIEGGTLDLNGHTLTVNEDVTQTNGTINLNQGTLKVGGEFSQTGGTVTANKGKLYIDGSYTLSDYSQLTMSNDKDYIFAGKGFTVATNGTVSLRAGTLEVAGNFTQKGYYNFSPSGTHKVVLSGKDKQTISFENPSYSYFNILELTKPLPTGYRLETTVNWKQLIEKGSDPKGQTGESLTITSDWKLPYDITVNALKIEGGTLDLDGHTLTVKEDMTQTNGTINLNQGTLKVGGEFSQTGGLVIANKGKLYIDGSYTLSDYGQLTMLNDKDYIFAGKDFTVTTNNTVNLRAGTLEVAGNFTQKGYYNFSPSGTHKVVLSGKGKQTVTFENSWYSSSGFNILELTKPLSSYGFDSTVTWKTLIERAKGIPVVSVALNMKSLTLNVGEASTALNVTIQPNNASNKEVSWSSSNVSVATVDKKGIVTAKGTGTAIITVTTKDGNKKATCKLTVKDTKAPGKPKVDQVTDKSTQVTGTTEAGATIQVKIGGTVLGSGKANSSGGFKVSIPVQKTGTELAVTATDVNGNESNVAIVIVLDKTAPAAPKVNTITNESVIVTGATEAGALVTVKKGTRILGTQTANSSGLYEISIDAQEPGTKLTVYATDSAGNISKGTAVNVIEADGLSHIRISEQDINLMVGESLRFDVYAVLTNGKEERITFNKEINYSVSSSRLLKVVPGLLKAEKITGNVTLTITYKGRSLNVPVTISAPTVTELEPSTRYLELDISQSKQVDIVAKMSDGTIKDVTEEAVWTTEDSTVAAVEKGEVEAVGAGITTIKAQYGGEATFISIEVKEPRILKSLEISERNLKMARGEENELSVWAVYDNGEKEEVTNGITWQSSKKSIVDVRDGVLTALKTGQAVITANYGGKKVTLNVSVVEKKVKSLVVSKKIVTLAPGKQAQLKLTAFYTDGTKTDATTEATWSTKRDSIAEVEDGLVKAKGKGTTTLVVEYGAQVQIVTVVVK